MRLENKVALITGAASGMGASMARIFAREGAKVVVADVLEEEGRGVAAEITQANGAAIFRRLDVSNEMEWKAAVDATLAEFKQLDILVNDAGLSGSAVEDLFDTAAWDRLMAVNARGVFLGMKFAIPIMKAAGGGAIVNISSISGITGQHHVHVGYNASKGAVRTLTKAAAVQHGRDNIRINSVHPGLMPPMRSSGRTADPSIRTEMLKQVPMGRAGRVEEVANAVLFLASDEASYITGAELWIDGGYLAT
ncbi:MAG: glucose 1-dehydrogenase [Alphaproteobacteria bacterium]|nr:glucose 1-dehydrogenase [Alphaproteobacteria bacterium]